MSYQTPTLGDAIRGLYDTDPDRPVYEALADRADALERERDQWHESAEFAAERIDRVVRIFEAVEPSATDADLVERVLRALDGAS